MSRGRLCFAFHSATVWKRKVNLMRKDEFDTEECWRAPEEIRTPDP